MTKLTTKETIDKNILNYLIKIIKNQYNSAPDKISFSPSDPGLIRENLLKYDFSQPNLLQEVLHETAEMFDKWNLNTSHKRYWGLFNGPAHFSSIVADALVAAYNPQLSSWSHAGAASEIELHVIKFFLHQFGLCPLMGSGHFTSGGSESNTTALLCALNKKFPHYKQEGLLSLGTRPLIYISEHAHHSLKKAACSVGIGLDNIRIVPTDEYFKIDLKCLREMIEHDKKNLNLTPLMVVATVGTTNAGVIDPINEISKLCQEQALWCHVDAAWGGAAVFSKRLKQYLIGIERADSITFDAHKWMSVSMGAGIFLCRNEQILHQTFGLEAEYMPAIIPGTTDLHSTSLQWSRRCIGLKVFFALSEQGLPGFQKQIEHQAEIGEILRKRLLEAGWIVLNKTPLPVVCFTHPLIRRGIIRSAEVLQCLYERRNNWISETKINNEFILRACVTHPQSSASDVEELIQDLNNSLRQKR